MQQLSAAFCSMSYLFAVCAPRISDARLMHYLQWHYTPPVMMKIKINFKQFYRKL